MATCPKCGTGKLKRKSDRWFYCNRHGRVKQVGNPTYQMVGNKPLDTDGKMCQV